MLSFHVKFVQTDWQMDRRTIVKQYAPIFRYGGIKKFWTRFVQADKDGYFMKIHLYIFNSFPQSKPLSTLWKKAFENTTLWKKPFENIVGKGENAGNQNFNFSVTFVICKCFNLDQTKILSFGKELNRAWLYESLIS